MSTSTKIQIFQALSHIQQELLDVLVMIFVCIVDKEINLLLGIFKLVDPVEEFLKEGGGLLDEDANHDLREEYILFCYHIYHGFISRCVTKLFFRIYYY